VDVLADQVEVLDASSKYALRALLNGVRTVEDLELFLGLSSGDTGLAVASLLVAEFIDYRAPTPGEPRRLELLPSGLEAAREASVRRPKATTIPVVYDRLARSITDWRKHDLIRSTDAKAEPRILLPPRGSGPVMVEDLDPGTISDALEHTARHDFRILGVSGRHRESQLLPGCRPSRVQRSRLGDTSARHRGRRRMERSTRRSTRRTGSGRTIRACL